MKNDKEKGGEIERDKGREIFLIIYRRQIKHKYSITLHTVITERDNMRNI